MQPHSCGEPYGDTYPQSFKEPQLTSLCWNLKNEEDKIQSELCTEKKILHRRAVWWGFYSGEGQNRELGKVRESRTQWRHVIQEVWLLKQMVS